MKKYFKGIMKLNVENKYEYALSESDMERHIKNCAREVNVEESDSLKVIFALGKRKVENKKYGVQKVKNEEEQNNETIPLSSVEIKYYILLKNENVNINNIRENIENVIVNFKESNFDANYIVVNNKIEEVICSEIYDEICRQVSVCKDSVDMRTFFDKNIENKEIEKMENVPINKIVKKVNIANKKYTYEELKKQYAEELKYESLNKEIKRIYELGDTATIQGINYKMNEDNTTIRNNIYKVLTTALYSMGRVKYPEYNICNIDLNDANWENNMLYLKNRFKLSKGEMYFWEFSSNEEDGYTDIEFGIDKPRTSPFRNRAISGDPYSNVGEFFENIKKYQFDFTFSVYITDGVYRHTPVSYIKNLLLEFQIIEFSEELNYDAQISYVKKVLSQEENVDLLPKMIEVIEYQKNLKAGLSTNVLDDYIFDIKKNNFEKVYNKIYKQADNYKEGEDAYIRLQNTIGLDNLKKSVEALVNRKSFNNIKKNNSSITKSLTKFADFDRLNFIFAGDPGTGKSMSADLLAKVLYQQKLISKDIVIKHGQRGGTFIDGYERDFDSAISLRNSFRRAKGGVLLIDEAGHLSDNDITVLLEMTEGIKNDTAIILCGYEKEMNDFLKKNEGLRSRFPNVIKFENYTVEELVSVFIEKAKEKHFSIEDKAVSKLKEMIKSISIMKNFGSIRTIENLLEKLISVHADSKIKEYNENCENTTEEVDMNDLYVIGESDFNKIKLEDLLGEEYLRYKKYGNPKNELEALVGLKNIKNEVSKYIAKGKMDLLRQEKGLISKKGLNMHLCFTGNPGTAKTTVARLIGRILYDEGILATPKFVECGASDLVAEYVGQTGPKVVTKFEEASGGILFLDEAYTLANEKAGGFNRECIDTIIKEMENHRDNVIVIFAGYKKPMVDFIESNPGFKSRISHFIDFENYSDTELIEIFNKILKDEGYKLSDKVLIENMVGKYLSEKKKEKDFGNGRECRLLIEKAIDNQSNRLMKKNKKEYTSNELITLRPEDFDIENKDFYEDGSLVGFIA